MNSITLGIHAFITITLAFWQGPWGVVGYWTGYIIADTILTILDR